MTLAWAAAGLAVLSKGLIGLVLPGLVLAPWLLARRDWAGLRLTLHPLALAVFALVALPWFVAMQGRFEQFFDYFVMEQHFRRFAGTTFNNAHPWFFFLLVLPLATLPASLRLPLLLRDAWRERSGSFEWWWIAAILLFFSLPRSKLVGYALPALLPLALLLAQAWRGRRGERVVIAVGALLCVAAVAGVTIFSRDHAALAQALRERIAPGDRVVLADEHFFDLRLHARLTQPPAVLQDWDRPDTTSRDNWRKELADAARFAPDRGASVLWTPARFAAELCRPGVIWLIAPPGFSPAELLGRPNEPLFLDRSGALRRIEAGPAACAKP